MKRILKNRTVRLGGGLLICMVLYVVWDFKIQRNFHTVVEGKLYRSGQPSEEDLVEWIDTYDLKTIMVLKPTLKPYEQEIATRRGVTLFHIPLSTRQGPSEQDVREILGIMTDDDYLPLLYHCHGGADKTGLVTALYRIEVQHWPLWKALLEMNLRYHIPWNRPALQEYLCTRYSRAK